MAKTVIETIAPLTDASSHLEMVFTLAPNDPEDPKTIAQRLQVRQTFMVTTDEGDTRTYANGAMVADIPGITAALRANLLTIHAFLKGAR